VQSITLRNHREQTRTHLAARNIRTPVAILFLIFAVLGSFHRAIYCDFLSYDDNIHIVRNPWLNPPTWESLGRFWSGPYWGEYVPLTYSLWALESHVAERDVEGNLTPKLFHFVNVALHAMATVVVFLIIKDLTTARGPAMLAALLFGLHPLQVEPVAWVSETRGVLSGFFGLLAIWMYARFAQRVPSSRRGAVAWYVAATTAFVLALLSKSSAVAIVPITAVIAVLLFRRRAVATFIILLPWAAAAAIMAIVMTSQQGLGSIAYYPTLVERIAMSGDAVAFYVGKLIWPTRLCADYGWYPLFMREQWWFNVLPLVSLALFGAAWLLRRRSSLLLGLLVFVAALSPVLGLVPFTFQEVSLVADRFAYLAMLGPALVLGMATRRLSSKWIACLAVGLTLVLGVLSVRQTLVWRNDFTLSGHARQVNRRSIFAATTLAQQMMHRGEREEAFHLCQETAQLNPNSARAQINLAQVHTFYGNSDAAFVALRNALTLHPTSSLAHRMLAEWLEKQDKLDDAIDHYRQALKYGRRDADRAVLHVRIGSALLRLRQDAEAATAFESAIQILPHVASDVWIVLAQARLQSGDTEAALEAIQGAEAALSRGASTPPEIYVAIAQLYAQVGHTDDALRLADRAAAGYRQNDDAAGLRRIEQLIESWSVTSESR